MQQQVYEQRMHEQRQQALIQQQQQQQHQQQQQASNMTPALQAPMQPVASPQQPVTAPNQPVNIPTQEQQANPKVNASGPSDAPVRPSRQNFDWIPGLTEEDLFGLTNTLIQACNHKIEPTELVKMFLQQHGKETIAMLPAVIDEDRFIESIRKDVALRETVLATGRGKRFLKDVWQCIKKMTSEEASEEKKEEEQAEEPEASEKPSNESD
jgi:hypothetical protein